MGRLGDAKTLGGVGSILQLIPVFNLVGYILTLIATKYVSDELQDKTIFDNMLYAVIAGIVGVAVGLGTLFTDVFFSIFGFGLTALFGVLTLLVVIWIALVISSIFIRRAFDSMAAKLNISNFRTAGILYFVGALLTIVFFIGLIVIFVALIFQIIAFFSIQETSPAQPVQAPMAPAQPAAGMKFCPNGGTQIAVSVLFCPKCGMKQP